MSTFIFCIYRLIKVYLEQIIKVSQKIVLTNRRMNADDNMHRADATSDIRNATHANAHSVTVLQGKQEAMKTNKTFSHTAKNAATSCDEPLTTVSYEAIAHTAAAHAARHREPAGEIIAEERRDCFVVSPRNGTAGLPGHGDHAPGIIKSAVRRVRAFFVVAALAVIAAIAPEAVRAQDMDDLGVVWNKTYGPGTILNIKFAPGNPHDTYTACGYPWTSTSSKLERLTGLLVEFDESGNILDSVTLRIPQSYIDDHPGALISDDASARFDVAFKTDDGGYLVFGRLLNRGAPISEKQTNWSGGTAANSPYLTYGLWLVKFNSAMQPVRNELVKGMWAVDGWRTSDGNFVVGGFDVSDKGVNTTATSDSITLLRKYNHSGNVEVNQRDNYSDIRSIYKSLTGDDFIALAPNRLLRIDQNLKITGKILTSLTFPGMGAIPVGTISPTTENGGAFLGLHLNEVPGQPSATYNNGSGFYKIDASNTLQFYKTVIPGDTLFQSPLLLPGNSNPPKYIGTANVYDNLGVVTKTIMYELTDSLTTGDLSPAIRTSDVFPSGTTLKAVSQTDGFFSCGSVNDQATIVKLSTCSSFTLNAGPELTLRTAGMVFLPERTVRYTGNANGGTVTYTWTLTDITSGGTATNLASLTDTGTGSGGSFTIPAQTVLLLPGKTSARLQYSITMVDSYTTSGVPQTCQQTQTANVNIEYDLPDNVSDADCFVDIEEIVWSIKQGFTSNTAKQKMTAYTTPLVGDVDKDGIPEVIVYNFYSGNEPRTVDSVYVFWGTDRANPTRFKIPTTSYMHPMGALARIPIGNDTIPMLVFQATDGFLYAYNPATGLPIAEWNNGTVGRSDAQINDWGGAAAVTPQAVGFADFDGDGQVEVYASRSVWAAENGKLLARGIGNKGFVQARSASGYKHYYTVAADVDEDGIVDLAAGTHVY
ncbi:MAG: VCBS repeat-containing protein, partial [Bacteroidales bacterium]|nr:VCBS repeat-containing protein [Bacteroidales bacterium]